MRVASKKGTLERYHSHTLEKQIKTTVRLRVGKDLPKISRLYPASVKKNQMTFQKMPIHWVLSLLTHISKTNMRISFRGYRQLLDTLYHRQLILLTKKKKSFIKTKQNTNYATLQKVNNTNFVIFKPGDRTTFFED